MRNKILAKCTADINPLKDRKDRLAQYIEIHLRDTEPLSLDEVKKMTRNIADSGLKAMVIHSPMHRKYILESFGNKEANERMHLVSRLAQNMYELNHEDIVVVIHHELSLEQLEDFGMIERITEFMKELIETYPHVKFAIENPTLLGFEEGKMVARSSYHESPVTIARYMRKKLKTDKIGTVLDTCHALSSVRILKSLKEYNYYSDISLEQYLEDYSDTLFLIHLSNSLNIGFGRDHGQVFESNEDVILLHHILSKICEIEYEGPITLETLEIYPNKGAPMYSQLIEQINSFVKVMKI